MSPSLMSYGASLANIWSKLAAKLFQEQVYKYSKPLAYKNTDNLFPKCFKLKAICVTIALIMVAKFFWNFV